MTVLSILIGTIIGIIGAERGWSITKTVLIILLVASPFAAIEVYIGIKYGVVA